MKYLIAFSGGLSSAVSALIAKENNLDYDLLFADTLIEHPDLYRFNKDIEAVTKPIITLTDGRTPWGVYEDVSYIGNSRTAPCSKILKTKQLTDYILANYLDELIDGKLTLCLGMNLDEEERLNRAKKTWQSIAEEMKVTSLLIDYKYHTRKQLLDKIESYNIRIPELYTKGYPHNNCGGFCVRAGQAQFYKLMKDYPEIYEYHENEMERVKAAIAKKSKTKDSNYEGFINIRLNKQLHRMSLKQFREWAVHNEHIILEKMKHYKNDFDVKPNLISLKLVDEFDMGGCGCTVDDKVSIDFNYTEDHLAKMNKSSNTGNSAYKNNLVYKETVKFPPCKVLDFGAGKKATYTHYLREEGFTVTPYDIGVNTHSTSNNPLEDSYDIIMCSNVVNVQPSIVEVNKLLLQLRRVMQNKTTDNKTILIINYGRSVRYLNDMTPFQFESLLQRYFTIEKLPTVSSTPLYKCILKD